MEEIYYKKQLIAIRYKKFPKGSVPGTPIEYSLQILMWNHKKGYKCTPHFHIPQKRETNKLSECFIVLEGKVRFRLFGRDRKCFKTLILKTGDILLYLAGGHEAEALTSCKMIELKNGPYIIDKEEFHEKKMGA